MSVANSGSDGRGATCVGSLESTKSVPGAYTEMLEVLVPTGGTYPIALLPIWTFSPARAYTRSTA
jgi:hypothetical protein